MPTLDLDSNQRTVLHLAPFFIELKSQAQQVAQQADAVDRGYFSIREEEATRGLLVSYWHARNALFELVTSLRQAPKLPPEDHPRAFLIGFSAALLLVDAARFLREVAEARPIVKQKLNEPAPAFGIPAGVYNTIQKSLLSSLHGWHLFHAMQYFEQYESLLSERAAGNDLEDLLKIIQRLKFRLDVPVRQFASAKLKSRAVRLSRQFTQKLFGRAMYGLQKLAGTLVADKYLRLGHQPALPTAIADDILKLLQPGDVLVVRKEYALTNYFLPGYWPHAALFLGSSAALQQLGVAGEDVVKPHWSRLTEMTPNGGGVMESMRDGVHLRPLSSPFGSDSIVVLRPQLTPQQMATALIRGISHQGKPYDFSFDFRRSDRLVCTEVVYRAFDGVGGMQLPLVQRIGRPTLSGDDLIDMGVAGASFDAVAVFAPMFSDRIATGAETCSLISEIRATKPPVD